MEVIEELRAENARLKAYIASLGDQNDVSNGSHPPADTSTSPPSTSPTPPWDGAGHGLNKAQVARYSRQIVLPSFGIHAQARLCNGSVLVVGAGGLGSSAAIYLAAAGVGRLGIVDRDTVELSNIHRQIIHTEAAVGTHKAESAASTLHALNSSVKIETFKDGLTPANALSIIRNFDVIVDASDNAPTRYLLSDACAVARRPLVSGAAIGTDGQLTVYCYGEDGPCYRCLFPSAPAPQNCARCVDAGVLGVVPGVIGTMQALEAVKILAVVGEPMSRKLLVMDALGSRVHIVKLRARSPGCVACGERPEITEENLSGYDYAAFTGQAPNDAAPQPLRLIAPEHRLTPADLQARLAGEDYAAAVPLLIDVRTQEQFAICHLPGALNAPWKAFDKHLDTIKGRVGAQQEGAPVFVVCRRGNDSQRAVARLHGEGVSAAVDVVGGMEAWAKQMDASFPVY